MNELWIGVGLIGMAALWFIATMLYTHFHPSCLTHITKTTIDGRDAAVGAPSVGGCVMLTDEEWQDKLDVVIAAERRVVVDALTECQARRDMWAQVARECRETLAQRDERIRELEARAALSEDEK